MLLDHLLLFQEGFMVDLRPNLPQPRPWAPRWNMCSPHPSLQFFYCVQFCCQETKGKNWLFHRKTLAKDLNSSMNLLFYRKHQASSCLICFYLCPSRGYSHKCVTRASFSSLSSKLVCDRGSCSFVLWQGWCWCYCIFYFGDKISCLHQRSLCSVTKMRSLLGEQPG